MRLGDRLYRWALRAYPRDFQDESREEVLGTIADMQDAGEQRGAFRQALSLGACLTTLPAFHSLLK